MLSVGSDTLSLFNVTEYKAFFEQISSLLTEDAQIQIFGCSVSSDFFGQSMIQAIARFTGADVFASTDLTGGLSGDWDLEFASDDTVSMRGILDPDVLAGAGFELADPFQDYDDSWATAMDGILYFAYDDGVHGYRVVAQRLDLRRDVYGGGHQRGVQGERSNGSYST